METDFNYIDCIEKVKQHDDSASEALYRFTFPIVQKQVALFVHNRQDQEDLLQTIFIKIFEQLHTLKEPGKYPGWAKMIARNTCMDYGRHLKLENNLIQWKTTVSDEEEEGMDQLAVPTYSREFNPEAHIDAETTKELIDQILDGLSDKQRMVILLWMKQYKESEIAKELDMPIGSVRTNCRRGKAAIEKKVIELEKQGTKLYSMSPIVFFLWLLNQYDMLYMPTFTDAACMPLYRKIKLNIQKPDIGNETDHQMYNTVKEAGDNAGKSASSMKQAGKVVSVTKGGLKHGILHSTVTKIPESFNVNSMLSSEADSIQKAYSSATNSAAFSSVKNNISISDIFSKARSGVSSKSLASTSTLKSMLSQTSGSNKSSVLSEYNKRKDWLSDKNSSIKQNTRKYQLQQKLAVSDADQSIIEAKKKTGRKQTENEVREEERKKGIVNFKN